MWATTVPFSTLSQEVLHAFSWVKITSCKGGIAELGALLVISHKIQQVSAFEPHVIHVMWCHVVQTGFIWDRPQIMQHILSSGLTAVTSRLSDRIRTCFGSQFEEKSRFAQHLSKGMDASVLSPTPGRSAIFGEGLEGSPGIISAEVIPEERRMTCVVGRLTFLPLFVPHKGRAEALE